MAYRKESEAHSKGREAPRTFARMARDNLERRLDLYAPILHPGAFIEAQIKVGILEYEAKSGISTGLTPDSLVGVDYAPLVPANPNLRHEAPVKKTRHFTLNEIVTGSYQHEVRSWRRAFGDRYRVVGHQHQALIDHLTRKNLETQMTTALDAYRADPAKKTGLQSLYKSEVMQRCLGYLNHANPKSEAYVAVADFLAGKLQAREVKFHGETLNGVFLIPVKAGGILFSVDDAAHFDIGTTTNHYLKFGHPLSEQVPVYPTSDAFKQWVLSKLPVYEQYRHKGKEDAYALKKRSRSSMPWLGVGPTQGQVYANPFTFRATPSVDALTRGFYESLMQRLKSDIDTLVFTEGEQSDLNALDIAKTLLTIYSTAGAFASPGTGSKLFMLMTSLMTSGAYVAASAGQAAISDRPDQADEYLKEAIVSAALAGAFMAAPLAGPFANGIRYPFKSIPQALGYYRFVTEQAQKKTPRIIRQLLKHLNKPRVAAGSATVTANGLRKGAKQMRRASLAAPSQTPPIPRPALSNTEVSRKAIERALPLARARLDAAIRTAADPNHIDDTKRIARLFYGSDTPETLTALQRKQQLMKADLSQLKLANIDFLHDQGLGWSAQLQPSSYAEYKAGAVKEKYIEVNVDGALQYYRDMGNSDETLANTLIHEMSHGMPADEDFVYAAKLRGAREDIVDLLNLGKSTDPKDFRYLSADATDGTVSLFAREPQKHNADSTLFVAALLDQAKNNRALFEANMQAISDADAKAEGGLIKETVAVRIIEKTSGPQHGAPAFLVARDDQTGHIVGVFGKVSPAGTATRTLVNSVREVFKWS
ncbi:hypothetical protein DYL59_18645 [Pseudomonas kairouanensis]|uniref:Uncharacterized protein n=1 Tax=Pseudomonas kairouanensis TaxID=2293832 RepID=A0A4Z0AKT0_9PSED|nr:hypothetical protein [Pseudomonas kairouanensis]TFY87376.1 hypothetical protein DYL59_18645 [Pseudomonas kairouanensis]